MYCQNCKRRLSDVAETCKCGWSKNSAQQSNFVHCANEDCPNCALARVKTATGYANFCPQCYDDYHTEQARFYCVSRGLDTPEKQLEFCKKTIRGMREKIAA